MDFGGSEVQRRPPRARSRTPYNRAIKVVSAGRGMPNKGAARWGVTRADVPTIMRIAAKAPSETSDILVECS